MRYLLTSLLLAFVVLSSGCDPDGYSCNSEGCYAENNAQYLTLEDCLSVCAPKPGNCGDLVSHEGYDYSTVQIGDQCWFSENCRYLPFVSTGESYTSPRYYVYDYQGTNVEAAKATENYETYGVLYNWPAVMTEGICPSGWHIPSDEGLTQLTNILEGEALAGGKMKEAGYDHWEPPNTGATNSSGWTGLPGGDRFSSGFGYYSNIGEIGYWWSSSESGSNSWYRGLNNEGEGIFRDPYGSRDDGFSARCVRD
jgi:uncharacterized protein (TIGR02145 family)